VHKFELQNPHSSVLPAKEKAILILT